MKAGAILALCYFLTPFYSAFAQEPLNRVIPEYERLTGQICRERGQDYDGKRCVEPHPNQSGYFTPGLTFVARNYGACDAKLLIAYVPAGGSDYVVEGWWTARSGAYIDLTNDKNQPFQFNPNYPSYFYLRKADGRPVQNIPVHRRFVFEGKEYGFAQHGPQATDTRGNRWTEILCRP